MPVSGGPYLIAAFLCEKVLREQDGVTSFIRVVDRWQIVGPTDTMAPTLIQTNMVILFKSGIQRSPAQIIITPISPTDERLQSVTAPVQFEGDDERGVGVVLPMHFPVREPGLYWFEVSLILQGGQPSVMTFIPMRVVYLQTGSIQARPSLPPTQNPS
jgi:hypothetical protein